MANFEFTRPGGIWADLVGLGADDLADLDRKSTLAINSEGGSYAPTTAIEIGGQGIVLTGPAQFADITVNGDLNLLQGAGVEGDLTVHGDYFTVDGGTTTLTGPTLMGTGDPATATLYVTNQLLYAHKKLELLAGDEFGVSLTAAYGIIVNGASRFDAAVSVLGALSVSSGATLAGTNVTVGGTEITDVVTLRAPLVCTGNGRINNRGLLLTNPADLQTFSPAQIQWLVIPETLFGVTRTIGIIDAGCRDDDEFGVSNLGAFALAIQLPSGTTVGVGANHWANFKRFNNSWARITGGSFNAHSVAD